MCFTHEKERQRELNNYIILCPHVYIHKSIFYILGMEQNYIGKSEGKRSMLAEAIKWGTNLKKTLLKGK